MRLKNIFRHSRLIISWAVSYIIILIVTVAFNFYAYIIIEDNMMEQIDKINIELLQNRKQYIDNAQVIVNNLASQIAYDPQVQNMMKRPSADDKYKYDLLEVRKKITSWRYSDVEINNMYIYFHNTDYIVSGRTNTNSERYYRTYYSDKSISYEEYMAYLKTKNYGKYVYMPSVNENSDESNLFYFMTMFDAAGSVPLATVVVEIKAESWVERENDDGKSFIIFDRETGTVLGENTGNFVSELDIEQMNASGDVEMAEFRDKIILYIKSEQNNWIYMYAINNSQYTSVINDMRLTTGGMMVIWLIVGVCITLVFVKRQHKPVRYLVDRIESNTDSSFYESEKNDEFNYINDWLTKFLKEKEIAESKREVQNLILRDAILFRLFTGTNDEFDAPVENLLKNVGIEFKDENFAVVMFYFEDLSEIFFEANSGGDLENYKLAKLIVSNILEEVIPEEYSCLFCDIGGMLGCILNMKSADCSMAVREIDCAGEFIRKNFNIEFVAGMSSVHKSTETLTVCYREAMQCFESSFVDSGVVILYSDICEMREEFYYFPIEKEINMISCLKSGDFETARKILDEILKVNLDEKRVSIHKAKCLMYDIICAVMKAQNDTGEYNENNILEQDGILKRIEVCNTIKKIRSEITEIFYDICNSSTNRQSKHISEIVTEVKAYIDAYYDDKDLNGAAIAKHFYINQSYLSNIFKKTTKQGMLEYLTTIRVAKAMELLKTTDWSVEKISESVGYTNVRTFTRVFSKYAGASPGKFRGK